MQNCWEFLKCGREPGGSNVSDRGVCPAATFEAVDGFLGGKNGGMACAYIAGTFCCENLPGTEPAKEKNCAGCRFYDQLKYAYGRDFSVSAFLSFLNPGSGANSAEVLSHYPLSVKKSGLLAKNIKSEETAP